MFIDSDRQFEYCVAIFATAEIPPSRVFHASNKSSHGLHQSASYGGVASCQSLAPGRFVDG